MFKKILSAFVVAATAVGVTLPAQAGDLARIKEEGVMKIAMSGAYPPFNFVNEQNEVVGFDPALGIEIGKRLGVKVEVVTTAWDGIIGGLLTNKYDAIVGSMSITEDRAKVVDFVGPYYSSRRAVFTKPDSDLKSASQLKDAKLAVTLGETHEKWALDRGYEIRTYKGLPELLLELENGRVDGLVNDYIAAHLAIKAKGYNFVALEDLEVEPSGHGIAIRKGNEELRDAMQAALEEIMKDGTYMEIANKWIGFDIR
ncbi:transporter substrate-binding domain-containing protein [Terasakiella pusilla]|uniref:transporter substrate-binding domain-containing protein n=1 Tax=Terasakiella pusilla TaxID=64973 RepID=UPI003AA7E524